jgi:tetratricopeptide (TPR) repeat protein
MNTSNSALSSYSRELRFNLAHTCLLNGYEYEPDHPGLWMAKGSLLNWENRFAEALEAYRTAATIRSWTPPSVVANCIHGQGVALGALHRLTEARDAFAQALELDPEYEDAKRDLALVLYDLQQLRKREGGAPVPTYLM